LFGTRPHVGDDWGIRFFGHERRIHPG
jgi:hypothetical protein